MGMTHTTTIRTILFALVMAFLVAATPVHAAITVTRTSGTTFYTDTGTASPDVPKCSYVSLNVAESVTVTDAWVTIGNFTGGYLSLGGGDDGAYHVGPLTAGQTKPAFFYLCSSYTATTPSPAQVYDIRLYNGNPAAGGSLVDTTTIPSTTINNNVIQASSNSVNVIVSGPNPATIGGVIAMTIDGDTGKIGCVNPPSACTGSAGGPLSLTPAAFASWRADAYELIGSNITLSGGNSGSYDNMLYIDTVPSSSDTHYVGTFYFRAVGTTGATTSLSPVSYLASGANIKHTSLSSGAYSTAGGLQPVVSAQASVVLAKSVSNVTLPAQGGRVTYTLTATNSGLEDVSLDSFIDVLPAGATYVAGSSSFNGAGIANPGISGTTLTWSSLFTIPAGTSRSLIFQANIPATPGTYTNAATARIGSTIIDSTLQVTDNVPATATTVVLRAPAITKAFSPTAVAVNGTSVMTLTITNPNTANSLNGIAVSDTLPAAPAGLGFAVPSGAATTCSGAVLTVSGTTIGITGGTLAAGQTCTVTANVTSASANTTYTNTTGTVSSTNGGTGSSASATITFSTKPTISKSFSVPTIPRNGTAAMTFTITNNGNGALTGLTFDDLFPAGMVTASPPAVTPAAPCGGVLSAWNGATASALMPTGGDAGIRLTGGGIPTAGGTCSFTVNVTAATAGIYNNTSGGVTANETSPAGPGSNTATISVLSPPTVAKAFSPATIGKGQTSTLTITLANANATAITGAAFTDTYPASVTTAATANTSTTCSGGTVSFTGGSVSFAGGAIPPNGSCTVSIDVTSSVVNSYTNTIGAGAVTTTNAGSNSTAASATLTVNATPTITKSFSFNAATGAATMSITIVNNHTEGISGLSFTDLFPSGMTTANPPALSPAAPCGAGSSLQSWNGATAGALSGTGGDGGVRLTAGQIPAAGGSCTFTINLAVNSLGVYANQTSGVTLTAPFAGTGSVSNTATWIAPAVSKTFTPNTAGPGDIVRMEIRITNPSLTTALTGVTLNDTYPTTATLPNGSTLNGAAITNAATPNTTSTCGGTVTAAANGTGISLAGGSLLPGGVCTIAADVRATNTTPATYYNTTGRGASDQGIGITGSDALYIVTKPTITKSFLTSPVTIASGTATSVMRITIENNAGADISGVSFTDTFPTLPSQMKWVNTIANSCGGSLTDVAGAALVANSSTGIKLTGGTITAAAVTCTIDVTVSVSATGSYNNTTSGVTSLSNTSPGPNSNTATLVAYLSAPTVTKSFTNSGFQVDGSNRLTITLTNPNAADITGVTLTDTFPASLFIAAIPNLASTCSGTATAAAGTATLSLAGGTIPASGSCSLAVDVTATAVGTYTNTLGVNAITSTNANPAPAAPVSSSTSAYLPPTVTKGFAPATIGAGGSSSLVITVTNPAANPVSLTGVSINDLYTGTLANNAAGAVACSGGGSATLTGGSNGGTSVGFSGGTIVPGGSCTITQSVTATGTVANTTGAPVATGPVNPLTGTAASATLTIFQLPSLIFVKQASTATAAPGQAITYTLLTTNSGSGIATSVILSDALSPYVFWGVNSFGANVPFQMGDGPPISGLTLGTPVYSSDNGATWTYVPVSGAGGAPAGYDGYVTNWRIPMTGTMNGNGANFTLQYKVMVR
ncbi:beta strand repeat-containing protein [Geomobilimonas luticola]|uniref:DUF11 domain-containing protein n=1 Tax=Geomobilimonas luticola TaxID=1114878 RepID=A0ABS5SFH4_9BACT|nr:DUF11 domain-containing protein [Geomobilimonas luticola]MBT0653264.1 DUF11 domain-containing protein [Geomobilimonas luticola]